MSFCHLHVHTSKGSHKDSMVRIPELVQMAKDNKMKYVAITDHGSLAGVADFYDECTKQGVTPIIGCEFYASPSSRTTRSKSNPHLVVLAKNRTGYDNLIKLMRISNLEGKYMSRGCIDDEVLEEHKEGLICLSACIGGKIPLAIIKNNMKLAEEYCLEYKRIFGDDFYLELMDNDIPDQYKANDGMIELSKKLGIGVVMTVDIHYLHADDEEAHGILLRMQYNTKDNKRNFPGTGYYFRTADEFKEEYKKYTDTSCITKKIEKYSIYDNDKGQFFMPKVDNAASTLEMKTSQGMIDKGLSGNEKYEERVRYELDVINKLGFPDYFLIVADAIQWCKRNKILVGPGRGSAGGCLVSYLLDITSFDPMNDECPLYFERFLNPHRISPPDIDTDVTDRDMVIEYLKATYGKDMVINIGTTTTLGTKDVINNVARVMPVSDYVIKPLLDVIPSDTNDITNKQLYETNETYRNLVDNNATLKTIYSFAVKLEGLYKNSSVHASGVIISSQHINVPVNIYKGTVFTEYDMENVEKLGYIKFDFLGLKTLRIIEECIKKINDSGTEFKIEDIDYWNPDEKTMSLIRDCKTTCVFQWESDGYKNLISQMKPDTLSELVDLNTLYRPGPMESGMTAQYINRKFGKEPKTPIHPCVDGMFKRQALPLFQEEIMTMCREIAGFSMAEADTIRKAIGKKIKELLEEQKTKFIDGCKRHRKLNDKDAQDLWEKLEKFSRYSWNLSHGLAYTIISYWTAYLSAHYPEYFFASHMDVHSDNRDRMLVIISEARSRGVEIVSPDVNLSEEKHTVVDSKVYMTLQSISGIGDGSKFAILSERVTNGKYKHYDDFCTRIPKTMCNSEHKESLIYAGAFDSLYKGDSFSDRMTLLDKTINKKNKNKVEKLNNMTPLKMIKEEFNKIGFYVSETPIDMLKLKLYNPNAMVVEIASIHKHIDKKGNAMCFVTATDYVGTYDFVVFASIYKDIKDYIKTGNVVAMRYSVNGGRGFKTEGIVPLICGEEMQHEEMKKLCPVVEYETEISSELSFNRCIIKRQEEKLVLYYKEGTGSSVDLSKISGYTIRGVA